MGVYSAADKVVGIQMIGIVAGRMWQKVGLSKDRVSSSSTVVASLAIACLLIFLFHSSWEQTYQGNNFSCISQAATANRDDQLNIPSPGLVGYP